ncbi:TIGR02452 family protein, partial [Promicromonospora kroppenstedtii]|uniref:TIGR02452 family protein n=1 Tax=Promicromonospora kroppenstedtii TaxID=440482 RepID=UPI000A030B24
VAAAHGCRRLVLGAWGCGVFGNDPDEVATTFAEALASRRWFEQVVFAILDTRPGQPVLRAFERALAPTR